MINISIQNNQVNMPITVDELITFSNELFIQLNIDQNNTDLTIVLGDDGLLTELNSRFRGIDTPTDVLSFPADEIDPETGHKYIGDVIVSLERVNEQSVSAGHPIESELKLLIIHGILHLLGHDHQNEDDKNEMWRLQNMLLLAHNVNLKKHPD